MPELLYKTRENTSPQGKPRVCFTCHPDDFDACFEPIAEELLKRHNCAVWYKSSPDSRFDSPAEMDAVLGQMQLFVVPVTRKLLEEPNEAMDTECLFAKERHIPILPLMREHGLDEPFTRRFGTLQYLDPDQRDMTAISFDQKLSRYLESVLVSDELAKRVRAAFDAYVFLSYRKKDREYAQKLMRMIHGVPCCRDIAIWYDEYLVPGEHFDDAILDALCHSDLFALLVTPNLVNEKNYVRDVEYPLAKENDKPIVPVEMKRTDMQELREHFPEIPDSISGLDNERFSSDFLSQIRRYALNKDDASPEHLFLIGLAYLDGVDVEMDFDRALEMILSAAQSGFDEAMYRLYVMYHEGKGVERNYGEAKKWIIKCRDLAERSYITHPSQETFDRLCGIEHDLVLLLTEDSPYFKKDVRRELEREYSFIADMAKDAAAKGYRNAGINEFRGNYGKAIIAQMDNDLSRAIRYFTRADSNLYFLRQRDGEAYHYEALYLYFNKGRCYREMLFNEKNKQDREYRFTDARLCFMEAISSARKLVDRMPYEAKRLEYFCESYLADLSFRFREKVGELERYKSGVKRCFALCEQLIETYNYRSDKIYLAIECISGAIRQEQLKEYEKAEQYYRKALALYADVFGDDPAPDYDLGYYANAYYHFACFLYTARRFSEAETNIMRSLELFSAIFEATHSADVLVCFKNIQRLMIKLKKASGDERQADLWTRRFNETSEQLKAMREKEAAEKPRPEEDAPAKVGDDREQRAQEAARAKNELYHGNIACSNIHRIFENYASSSMNAGRALGVFDAVLAAHGHYIESQRLYTELYDSTGRLDCLRDAMTVLRRRSTVTGYINTVMPDFLLLLLLQLDVLFHREDIPRAVFSEPSLPDMIALTTDAHGRFSDDIAAFEEAECYRIYDEYDSKAVTLFESGDCDGAFDTYSELIEILHRKDMDSADVRHLLGEGYCKRVLIAIHVIGGLDLSSQHDEVKKAETKEQAVRTNNDVLRAVPKRYRMAEEDMRIARVHFEKAVDGLSDRVLWRRAVFCRQMANKLRSTESILGERNYTGMCIIAEEAAERISSASADIHIRRFLAGINFEVGLNRNTRDSFLDGFKYLEGIVGEQKDTNDMRFLEQMYLYYAKGRFDAGRMEDVAPYCQKALDLLGSFETGEEAALDMAFIRRLLFVTCKVTGQSEEANDALSLSFRILRENGLTGRRAYTLTRLYHAAQEDDGDPRYEHMRAFFDMPEADTRSDGEGWREPLSASAVLLRQAREKTDLYDSSHNVACLFKAAEMIDEALKKAVKAYEIASAHPVTSKDMISIAPEWFESVFPVLLRFPEIMTLHSRIYAQLTAVRTKEYEEQRLRGYGC